MHDVPFEHGGLQAGSEQSSPRHPLSHKQLTKLCQIWVVPCPAHADMNLTLCNFWGFWKTAVG